MGKYTLVVIDMQPSFLEEYNVFELENLTNTIKREIRSAMRLKCGIVFVEFNGFTSTIPELKKLTNNYPLSSVCTKYDISGASELYDFFQNHEDYPYENLKVCGIYLEQCVKETVNGLAEKELDFPKIELLKYACLGGDYMEYFRVKDINSRVKITNKKAPVSRGLNKNVKKELSLCS